MQVSSHIRFYNHGDKYTQSSTVPAPTSMPDKPPAAIILISGSSHESDFQKRREAESHPSLLPYRHVGDGRRLYNWEKRRRSAHLSAWTFSIPPKEKC